MAEEVGGIVYEVGMDVKGLEAGTKRARDEFGRFIKAGDSATDSLNGVDNAAKKTGKSFGGLSGSANSLKTSLTTLAGAISVALVMEWGKAFLTVADSMTQLQARITRLSTDAAAAKQTFSDLAAISSRTGASLSDTTKLWETLTSSLKEAGATNAQVLNLTDTLQKIGRIGGSSTEEMANALRQFGQSIASGTIRAEEFNSILEQMPELARQIATGLGMSMGQLRQAMLDGKLTAQDALNAIQDRTVAVNEEFSKLPRSLSQATGSLETSFAKLVVAINNATGASSTAVDIIDKLAGYVDMLGDKSTSTADKLWSLAEVISKLNPGTLGDTLAGLILDDDDEKKLADYNAQVERFTKASKDGYEAAKKQAEGIKHVNIVSAPGKDKKKTGKSTEEKQAESVAEKLEQLRQKAMLAASSTQELSRAQAILNAEQSLGKGATQEQIKLAGEYAAKIWDTGNALKNQAQQEQANKAATQVQAQAKTSVNPLTGEAVDPFASINLEEAQKLELYQSYYQQGLINKQTYEDTKTAIEQMAANERNQIAQDENDKQAQNMSQLLGATSSFFGEMAGAVGDYAGESSAAYKALFAVSKGFAIAQASMNLITAISNASALPWPANIPAIAFAAAQGANLIAQVRGANYGGGRKNGGPMTAGSMYEVGEGNMPELFRASDGSQYAIPGNNGRMFSNKDVMNSGGGNGGLVVYNQITNNTSARVSSSATQNADGSLTISTLIADLDNGGELSQGISRNFDTQRRANE